MPRTIVNRLVLDKHFVSSVIGQPVTEFLIRKGSSSDGFASSILSLDVRTTSGEILHLIFKSMTPLTSNPFLHNQPLNCGLKDTPEEAFRSYLELYPIEIQFYTNIAPLLEKINPDEPLPIPKLYAAEDNAFTSYLVMEDLRPIGYKTGDKYKGLTLPEVSLVMQALSKFHAYSYILLKQQGHSLFNTEKSLVFIEKHALKPRKGLDLKEFTEGLYQDSKDILRKRRDPELSQRMAKFTGKVQETIVRPWEITSSAQDPLYFPVLNHGDLWVQNILFLYDKNALPVDVKLIDFQQCKRGCIWEDLLYFFMCSTTPEFRKQNLNLCLEQYFKSFSKTLETLKIPLPQGFSLECLIKLYNDNLDSGFCYAVFAIPFQLGIFTVPPSPATPLPSNKEESSKFDKFNDKSNVDKSLLEVAQEFVNVGVRGDVRGALENSEKAISSLENVVIEMIQLQVL